MIQATRKPYVVETGVCETCKFGQCWSEEGGYFSECDNPDVPWLLSEAHSDLGTKYYQCPFWRLKKLSWCMFHRHFYEEECSECVDEMYEEMKKAEKREEKLWKYKREIHKLV